MSRPTQDQVRASLLKLARQWQTRAQQSASDADREPPVTLDIARKMAAAAVQHLAHQATGELGKYAPRLTRIERTPLGAEYRIWCVGNTEPYLLRVLPGAIQLVAGAPAGGAPPVSEGPRHMRRILEEMGIRLSAREAAQDKDVASAMLHLSDLLDDLGLPPGQALNMQRHLSKTVH